MVDEEIKIKGFEVLSEKLGLVDAERFISLVQRGKFDYTQWRQSLFPGMNGKEISRRAMEFQQGKASASFKVAEDPPKYGTEQ